MEIYSKRWKLCVFPDYDRFRIPLTYKSTFFLAITTLFLLALTVVWTEVSEKEESLALPAHNFFMHFLVLRNGKIVRKVVRIKY